MSEKEFCDWHVLHVVDCNDGERDIDVLHPEECGIRLETGRGGTQLEYLCWIAFEMSEGGCIGYKTLDEYEPGWYRVRGRTYTIPGGPWGPAEADVEAEEVAIRWERMEKESEVEIGSDKSLDSTR